MTELLDHWHILWIPFAVMIISQLAKLVLEVPEHGFRLRRINSYGGMPSSHTALLVSLTLLIGLQAGFTSPLFAVTAFVAAVFIRDAYGIRWQLGFHGQVINHIIAEMPEDKRKQYPKHLETRLGHTPAQVAVGAIVGVVLTLVLRLI